MPAAGTSILVSARRARAASTPARAPHHGSQPRPAPVRSRLRPGGVQAAAGVGGPLFGLLYPLPGQPTLAGYRLEALQVALGRHCLLLGLLQGRACHRRRLRQRGLGFGHPGARLPVVELHKKLAGRDAVALPGPHSHHGAGHCRSEACAGLGPHPPHQRQGAHHVLPLEGDNLHLCGAHGPGGDGGHCEDGEDAGTPAAGPGAQRAHERGHPS